jgi:protein-L-isoaspartate(D-aspartate) O-methyltransferase
MTDCALARHNMVESQLRPNAITDPRLIAAFDSLPREQFVGPELAEVAYLDRSLPLGAGRHLLEPMVLAQMLQALAITEADVVLDIGCATGYSTAVMSKLAATVVALESDADFAVRADENLTGLGVDNAAVVAGELAEGYPSQAPFDVIFIGGAVPAIPAALSAQLVDGGRLCAVIAGDAGAMGARLSIRTGDKLDHRAISDAVAPEMPGFAVPAGFVF